MIIYMYVALMVCMLSRMRVRVNIVMTVTAMNDRLILTHVCMHCR
jgi:hypothetical protein